MISGTVHHKELSLPKKEQPKAKRPQPQIPNAHIMPITPARRAPKIGIFQKGTSYNADLGELNIRFTFQGHSDVVRSLIFAGGSSPL